jgi:hydroxymethylglutaryl-CoA lyase
MQIPKQVLVTDVVARDGFQNEDRLVSTEDKLRVIEGLVRAGVTSIEVTSFVHPVVVPQLADRANHYGGV